MAERQKFVVLKPWIGCVYDAGDIIDMYAHNAHTYGAHVRPATEGEGKSEKVAVGDAKAEAASLRTEVEQLKGALQLSEMRLREAQGEIDRLKKPVAKRGPKPKPEGEAE